MTIAQVLPSGKILTITFQYESPLLTPAMSPIWKFIQDNSRNEVPEEACKMVDDIYYPIVAKPVLKSFSVLEPKKDKWVGAADISAKDYTIIKYAIDNIPYEEYTTEQAKQAIIDYYEPPF